MQLLIGLQQTFLACLVSCTTGKSQWHKSFLLRANHIRSRSSSSQKQENVHPHLFVKLLEATQHLLILHLYFGRKEILLCGGICLGWNLLLHWFF
nr:DnaJ subfamily C member 10 [Ipomoea batatas]